MKVKILIGKRFGYVDFKSPLKMSEDQKRKFLNFLETLFGVVETEKSEFRKKRLGDCDFKLGRKWTDKEYKILLNIFLNTEEVSEKLGRTWLSVDIRRGQVLGEFFQWRNIHNKPDPTPENISELIEDFLKYREKEKQKRKLELKKKRITKEKRIEELEKKRSILEKRKKWLELSIDIGTPRGGLTVEQIKEEYEKLKMRHKKVTAELEKLYREG